MYECLYVECDDGSGQDYHIEKHLTSMQHTEVFSWLTRYIAEHTDPSVQIVIGIAPGSCMVTESEINNLNSNSVSVIPNLFQQHQDRLQVVEDVAGKVVCILDDIWTTGRALKTCHQLVTQQRAKKVCLLASGETDIT